MPSVVGMLCGQRSDAVTQVPTESSHSVFHYRQARQPLQTPGIVQMSLNGMYLLRFLGKAHRQHELDWSWNYLEDTPLVCL